jgi:hypothetical protein
MGASAGLPGQLLQVKGSSVSVLQPKDVHAGLDYFSLG